MRVKASEAGSLKVGLTPVDPEFKSENVMSLVQPVNREWVDLVLRQSDFIAYKASRKPDPGLRVRSLTLWSFEGAKSIILDRVLVRRRHAGKD